MCMLSNINILRSLCSVLLFLVLAGNSALFQFYVVTRSYSSRPFLCALDEGYYKTPVMGGAHICSS